MVKNNYLEPNKTKIKAWVQKALQQSLKKGNIKSRFRVFRIWPLNHVAMVGKFGPCDVFIATKEKEHELSYPSNATNKANVNIKLLNIIRTF
jgi:nitrate reductase NapE component